MHFSHCPISLFPFKARFLKSSIFTGSAFSLLSFLYPIPNVFVPFSLLLKVSGQPPCGHGLSLASALSWRPLLEGGGVLRAPSFLWHLFLLGL